MLQDRNPDQKDESADVLSANITAYQAACSTAPVKAGVRDQNLVRAITLDWGTHRASP